MGWSGGTGLAEDVWDLVRKYIPEEERQKIAKKIYDMFCDMDADGWEGTEQLWKDKKVKKLKKEVE